MKIVTQLGPPVDRPQLYVMVVLRTLLTTKRARSKCHYFVTVYRL